MVMCLLAFTCTICTHTDTHVHVRVYTHFHLHLYIYTHMLTHTYSFTYSMRFKIDAKIRNALPMCACGAASWQNGRLFPTIGSFFPKCGRLLPKSAGFVHVRTKRCSSSWSSGDAFMMEFRTSDRKVSESWH